MNNIRLLYIDLFCGAGGTSTGVEHALYEGDRCAKVIACVNHDAKAIASHKANHPGTLHFTEDIRTLELSPLVSHLERCRNEYPEASVVLWASLECTNFSKAKGGLPRDADSRTLAEHLFRYIEAIEPDYIQIENVKEFMSWGDVDKYGKPISMDKGKSYLRWINNVKKYGYDFDFRILNAADYGAYTSRKRFFGLFARKGLPIAFPEATHSKNGSNDIFSKLEKWKPVRECLNFEDEGASIFTRKKLLAESTLERIYAGLKKFVADGKDSFIVKYNSVNSRTGKHIPPSIDEPCPTVATQNRLGIAKVAFLSKQFSGDPMSKNASVEIPAGTITCKDHHALVGVSFLCSYNYKDGDKDINAPCPTLLTKDRYSLVTCRFIANEYSGGGQLSEIDSPCPAILTTPKQKVVSVRRFLMTPQYNSAGGSVEKPCFTLIARMDKMPPYLIEAKTEGMDLPGFIIHTEDGYMYCIYETDTPMMKKIKEFMAVYGIVDITMRMLSVPELKRIMGFPENYILVGTQADQKKFIGNAVEVTMARVLCEVLVDTLMKKRRKLLCLHLIR